MFVVQLFTEFAYMARVTPRADVFGSALATKRPTCIVRLFGSRFEEIRATRINSTLTMNLSNKKKSEL